MQPLQPIQTDEELNQEAHEAYVRLAIAGCYQSFNRKKRACRAWLAKYIPLAQARGLTHAVLIMRRVAARYLLIEAKVTRRPLPTCQALMREAEALGWEDLFEKSLSTLAFCRYFADRMWNRVGLRYLLPLKREITAEYARTGDEKWVDLLQGLASVEQQLRSRSRAW